MGRNSSCVNKYDAALMAGPDNVVKDLYVRAPGVTLTGSDTITVKVLVGSSPGNAGNATFAGNGLECTLTATTGAQPNCQRLGSATAFPAQSGYFLTLQVTTSSQAPLNGTVYTTFELDRS